MVLILFKWIIKNFSHRIIRILLRTMTPVFDLFFYIKLLLVVLTWPTIQHPINIKFILVIWTTYASSH